MPSVKLSGKSHTSNQSPHKKIRELENKIYAAKKNLKSKDSHAAVGQRGQMVLYNKQQGVSSVWQTKIRC